MKKKDPDLRVLPCGVALFGETGWPHPGQRMEELNRTLRYGTPSKEQLLEAASIVSSYSALIYKTEADRRVIVRMLKRAAEISREQGEEE